MATIPSLREIAPTLSVGMLTADWGRLASELALLERTETRLVHFDVMDGCFVPMMTFGAPVVRGLSTPLLKDVHLMIRDPLEKVDAFVAAGADLVTVHVEACPQPHRVFQKLGGMRNANDPERGLVRGAALHPGTPLEVLEPLLDEIEMVMLLGINPGWGGQSLIPSTFRRIERVRERIATAGREILLGVDGGVNRSNIRDLGAAGADIVVTGSAVFDGKAPVENAAALLALLREGRG